MTFPRIPTAAQAIDYVQKQEFGWTELPDPTDVLRVFPRDPYNDGCKTMCVITNNATWDVWFEPGGRIYGEC